MSTNEHKAKTASQGLPLQTSPLHQKVSLDMTRIVPSDQRRSVELRGASGPIKITNSDIWNTKEDPKRQNKVGANKNFPGNERTGKSISFVCSM